MRKFGLFSAFQDGNLTLGRRNQDQIHLPVWSPLGVRDDGDGGDDRLLVKLKLLFVNIGKKFKTIPS